MGSSWVPYPAASAFKLESAMTGLVAAGGGRI